MAITRPVLKHVTGVPFDIVDYGLTGGACVKLHLKGRRYKDIAVIVYPAEDIRLFSVARQYHDHISFWIREDQALPLQRFFSHPR